jgi:hypothetical protein
LRQDWGGTCHWLDRADDYDHTGLRVLGVRGGERLLDSVSFTGSLSDFTDLTK